MIRTGKKLLVCGSINMDLVVRVDTLPTPRETVAGKSLAEVSGGKGANQAVAACRLGAEVAMLGMVGTDSFGNKLRSCLRQEGVQVDLVGTKEGPSGIAIIPVDKKGENMIIVVPGANGQLLPEDVDTAVAAIEDAGLVMLQLEIPVSTVLHVIRICKKRGIPVILNTAPVPEEFPGELLGVDLVCPNQKEAAAILGIPTPETIEEANHAAHRLIERGAKQAVLTMGGKGAVLACKMPDGKIATTWIEPYPVQAVDTVAAGDAFLGALAYRLLDSDSLEMLERASLEDACRFASAAAACSVMVPGAQPSLPKLEQVHAMMRRNQVS